MSKLNKSQWIGVSVAVVAAFLLFFGGTVWNFFSDSFSTPEPAQGPVNTIQPAANPPQDMKNISTVQGLEIYDEVVGTSSVVALPGKMVTVHYTGVLLNGTKFDSSYDHGQPFSFTLGAGEVIKGWDLGVAGMRVGGTRRLVISPELGYGNRVIGSIPANATLVFQVQLIGVN